MRDFNDYEQKMLNQSKEWLGRKQRHTQIPESLSREGYIAKMGETFATYFQLLRHCNRGTGQCFPSVEQIAKESGLSISTVKRHIVKLEKLGYIIVCRSKARMKNGTIKTDVNHYILVPPSVSSSKQSNESCKQHSAIQEAKEVGVKKTVATHAVTQPAPPTNENIGCPPSNMLLNPEIPEAELEKARQEFEILWELEGVLGIPKWFKAEVAIEEMMKNVKKFGYKPGYAQIAYNRLKANPNYNVFSFRTDYYTEHHTSWNPDMQKT